MHALTRARRLLAACVLVLLGAALAAAPTVGARGNEDHDGHTGAPPGSAGAGKVGVLLADHGEPPEYNEWTYESFREFFAHLIAMGVIPSWLTALETGTILYDARLPWVRGSERLAAPDRRVAPTARQSCRVRARVRLAARALRASRRARLPRAGHLRARR